MNNEVFKSKQGLEVDGTEVYICVLETRDDDPK